MATIVNILSFCAAWLACFFGAADGQFWFGPVVAMALLMLHLVLRPDNLAVEMRLIVAAGVLGSAVDTGLALSGYVSFATHAILPWMCPPWMVAVWMVFGSTLRTSLDWLGSRYVLAALFGVLGGPLSYAYGARIGALQLSPPAAAGLLVIGVTWALVVPLLLWLANGSAVEEVSDRQAEPAAAA
jgi:hypothetical protein